MGLALPVGLASVPAAAAGVALHVQVAQDACPNAALLRQQLAPLVGGDVALTIGTETGEDGSRHASVDDGDEHYAVEIDGLRRELDDPARNCVERARIAAVFIALNLRPASAAPVVTEVAPEPPAPLPDEPERARLGLQLFGEAAYSGEIGGAAPGAGAGVWLAHGSLHFAVSVAMLAATEVGLASTGGIDGSVELARFPLTLSASYLWRAGPFELGPALGLSADFVRLRGVGVPRPQTELRFSPGALAAAEVHLRLTSALLGVLRAGLTAFPRAYALRVEPAGQLARTPRLWLSASLGIEWQLH